jgi:hypothetical protein
VHDFLLLICVGGLPIFGLVGLLLFVLSLFALAENGSRMKPWYALPLFGLWLLLAALLAVLVGGALLLLSRLLQSEAPVTQVRLLFMLAAGVGPGLFGSGLLAYAAARRRWVRWWREPAPPAG